MAKAARASLLKPEIPGRNKSEFLVGSTLVYGALSLTYPKIHHRFGKL